VKIDLPVVFESRFIRIGAMALGCAAVFIAVPASAQTVFVTDDGNSPYAVYGVTTGGVATVYASGFNIPEGLAFDSSGNLFVSNAGNNTLSKVTPGGTLSTFATGFSGVDGLAVDGSGNLFVANNGDTIYEVTPGGVVSTFASGFSEVIGLAFDQSGNLFATDGGADTVFKITPAGTVSSFATGFGFPDGLAIDGSGDLFVSNVSGNPGAIYKVTPGGSVSTYATGLAHPRGLSFDLITGALFFTQGFSNFGGASLYEVNSGGQVVFIDNSLTDANFTALMVPIPEPSNLAGLAGVGAAGFAWWQRRRSARAMPPAP
jgi:sugar lactone lactonase YvrE